MKHGTCYSPCSTSSLASKPPYFVHTVLFPLRFFKNEGTTKRKLWRGSVLPGQRPSQSKTAQAKLVRTLLRGSETRGARHSLCKVGRKSGAGPVFFSVECVLLRARSGLKAFGRSGHLFLLRPVFDQFFPVIALHVLRSVPLFSANIPHQPGELLVGFGCCCRYGLCLVSAVTAGIGYSRHLRRTIPTDVFYVCCFHLYSLAREGGTNKPRRSRGVALPRRREGEVGRGSRRQNSR